MRYARILVNDEERVAVVETGPSGSDATELVGLPVGIDLLSAAMERRTPERGAPRWGLHTVELLSPVQPASFRDFVAFEEHVQGAVSMTSNPADALSAWAQHPTYLYGSPHSVIATGVPVAAPPGSSALDFELEVGVVIGIAGSNLTPAEAIDHIAGYVVVNDWSARDIQRHEMRGGLGPAKAKDFATTVGPWLVTPDEIAHTMMGERPALRMQVGINGEVFGTDSLARMGSSFPQLVSYASRGAVVRPGDLIASGTCAGGSLAEAWGRAGRQVPPPLQPGDVVTLTVDLFGAVENRVAEPQEERWPVEPAMPLTDIPVGRPA